MGRFSSSFAINLGTPPRSRLVDDSTFSSGVRGRRKRRSTMLLALAAGARCAGAVAGVGSDDGGDGDPRGNLGDVFRSGIGLRYSAYVAKLSEENTTGVNSSPVISLVHPSVIKMNMLQHPLIIQLLVLLVLVTNSQQVTSRVSDYVCYQPPSDPSDVGARCILFQYHWLSTAAQESVFKTFKYKVFEHGSGSFCVPFDIQTGKNNETITVFSYFACNYGWSTDGSRFVDEKACITCRNTGISKFREDCTNRVGAVFSSVDCCLAYATVNLCAANS
ncbi:hypothetical protein LINGRAHAP2_LOCUS8833 [Linum grandiflorum]